MLSVIQIVKCQIRHTDDRVHGRADVVAHSGEKICFGAVGFLSQIQCILQYGSGIFFGADDISNITSDKTNRMMEETAGYALRCLIGAIVRATENALLEYPDSSVVFAGGVASNTLLRSSCAALPAIFCPPQFATDNALGVAVLTWRALHG